MLLPENSFTFAPEFHEAQAKHVIEAAKREKSQPNNSQEENLSTCLQ